MTFWVMPNSVALLHSEANLTMVEMMLYSVKIVRSRFGEKTWYDDRFYWTVSL